MTSYLYELWCKIVSTNVSYPTLLITLSNGFEFDSGTLDSADESDGVITHTHQTQTQKNQQCKKTPWTLRVERLCGSNGVVKLVWLMSYTKGRQSRSIWSLIKREEKMRWWSHLVVVRWSYSGRSSLLLFSPLLRLHVTPFHPAVLKPNFNLKNEKKNINANLFAQQHITSMPFYLIKC